MFLNSRDVEKTLVELNYPVDARSKLDQVAKASEQKTTNDKKLLELTVSRLLQVELPAQASANKTDQLSILMELVTKPLGKKFKFHFFGNRKTNNPEKVLILFNPPSLKQTLTCCHLARVVFVTHSQMDKRQRVFHQHGPSAIDT